MDISEPEANGSAASSLFDDLPAEKPRKKERKK